MSWLMGLRFALSRITRVSHNIQKVSYSPTKRIILPVRSYSLPQSIESSNPTDKTALNNDGKLKPTSTPEVDQGLTLSMIKSQFDDLLLQAKKTQKRIQPPSLSSPVSKQPDTASDLKMHLQLLINQLQLLQQQQQYQHQKQQTDSNQEKTSPGGQFAGFIFRSVVQASVFVIVATALLFLLGRYLGNMTLAQGNDPSKILGVKSPAKKSEKPSVTFADVKGANEAVEQLQEVVDYLRQPQKFKEMGAKTPKGVLLVGPPGTGKTLVARAVAGEAGVNFFFCSGSEFDEVFVGVGPKRVRQLFAEAKASPPSIIFIDEIDTIGSSRKRDMMSARDGTLNQLLTEIDGFEQDTQVILIGATNFPESLDKALIRPGRFDKVVVVPPPDLKGRKEIIDLYLNKVKVGPDVCSLRLARATPGLTGADLQNIVNLAVIKATRRGFKDIDMKLLEEAYDDVTMGVERKSTVIPEENRRLTAYHESGHALVAYFTEGANPIRKATIMPRGRALGLVAQMAPKDEFGMSKKQLLCQIAISMGGRAAEEFIFGPDEITTGASSDFEGATNIAKKMITEFGMSDKLGKTSFKNDDDLSQETLKIIDEEIQSLLNKQYSYAKNLLHEHESKLHDLAASLLEHETLTGEEVEAVLLGKPLNKAIDK